MHCNRRLVSDESGLRMTSEQGGDIERHLASVAHMSCQLSRRQGTDGRAVAGWLRQDVTAVTCPWA